MTLEQIRSSEKPVLIPADVAEVLGCNPHAIRIRAAEGTLPFPCVRIGSRTKIPRLGFLRWMDGQIGGVAHDVSEQTREETDA